jgi:hypothetical protein
VVSGQSLNAFACAGSYNGQLTPRSGLFVKVLQRLGQLDPLADRVVLRVSRGV